MDDAVAERMARQAILDRADPPLLWILLDEAVLERPVGGSAVMRTQLCRLLEAAEESNISVRIVPRSAGAHPGQDGSFKLMRVEIGEIGFVEAPGGGRLILDSDEVVQYGVRYDRIGAKALPEDLSSKLIAEAMERLR